MKVQIHREGFKVESFNIRSEMIQELRGFLLVLEANKTILDECRRLIDKYE